MSNLDNRISNADQLLTNDIDKFCESVTDFYSNASKPLLDIFIYSYRLTMNIGGKVRIECICLSTRCWILILLFLSADAFDSAVVFVLLRCTVDAFAKTNRSTDGAGTKAGG